MPRGQLRGTAASTDQQKQELIAYHDRPGSAAITRLIDELQDALMALAKDRTDQHRLAFPGVLPDVHKGIHIRKPHLRHSHFCGQFWDEVPTRLRKHLDKRCRRV